MEFELIFISSPYSHKDLSITAARFGKTVEFCAKLMMEGKFIFSPIVHGHEMVIKHQVPGDWAYWNNYCRLTLSKCERMYVLMMDGWEESNGVQGEIAIAKELNIPIEYIEIGR